MKILVTGGAGFIGSQLVDRLIKKHKVLVFDDLSNSTKSNLNKNAEFVKGDCRKFEQVSKIFSDLSPEVVYHLAADAAEGKAQFSPVEVTSRNYDAFIKVLTCSIKTKVRRFVFTSSIAVYGGIQTPFGERDLPLPEDLYGISKLAAEQSLKVMSKVHNFEYVVARPHNVYGPGQNMADPYRNVVMIWMNAILQKKPYFIYGNGEQRRCFTYIDEVIDALYNCGFEKVSGMTFNIGADKDYSLNELSQLILDTTKSTVKPIYLPERPQEVMNAVADHSLAKKVLKYKDKTPLREGILTTWKYASKMGPQTAKLKELEIPGATNLPRNWEILHEKS